MLKDTFNAHTLATSWPRTAALRMVRPTTIGPSSPVASAANPQRSVTKERIAAFNAAIERQADKHRVPVVKLSEEPVLDRYVSDIDGFHPSDEGHRHIANLFLAVILPEVAERDRGWEIASAEAVSR